MSSAGWILWFLSTSVFSKLETKRTVAVSFFLGSDEESNRFKKGEFVTFGPNLPIFEIGESAPKSTEINQVNLSFLGRICHFVGEFTRRI